MTRTTTEKLFIRISSPVNSYEMENYFEYFEEEYTTEERANELLEIAQIWHDEMKKQYPLYLISKPILHKYWKIVKEKITS